MKNGLFKLLALLVALAMIVTPASAQQATKNSQVLGPETDTPTTPEKTVTKVGLSETGLYILRLSDPALASYMGGIHDLKATSPTVTGEEKLDIEAPASQAYLKYLETRQNETIESINRTLGRQVEVQFQYLNALNGMAVFVDHAEALKIAELPGVIAVYPDTVRELDTDVGPGHIGAPAIWSGDTNTGLNTQGEGVIIGVIDSGANHLHPSFADVGGDGYDHENPFGAGTYVGYCVANPTFCNDKLIGAYSYNPLNGSPEDSDGHGSHTASTAGGNRHIVDLSDSISVTVSGVAPHANLIIYKVCNPGCPGSASIMAVDQGIENGVDVFNYSISGSDDPWNDPVDLAFLDAYSANIFVSASAGNDGPGASTVAKTGPWNASVANMTHGRALLSSADVTGPAPVPAELENLGIQLGSGVTLGAPLTAEIDYSPANLNGCAAFPAGYFSGKIALIQRGTCNFSVKVNNAVTAGAVGVVIFNNRSGVPTIMSGVPATPPSGMIGLEDGLAIQAYIDSMAAAVTIRINNDQAYIINSDWADIVSSGSSRGPSQFELLKPDYGAPGTNILAAVAADGVDPLQYGFYSGTSMAAPHGAGAAALLKALHSDWTPAEIKSAIAATANNTDMRQDTGSSVIAADPFAVGSGRINLAGAAMVGLVQDETHEHYVAANPDLNGDPKTLNQPSLVNYNCVLNCTWERTFTSVLTVTASYTATFVSSVPTLTVTTEPSSFTLDAGESITLQFTVDTGDLPSGEPVFGDVRIDTDTTTPNGTVADLHLTTVVVPALSYVPALVEIDTTSRSGSRLVSGVQVSTEVLTLTATVDGLVPGEMITDVVAQDPTTANPFNGDGGTLVHLFTVPADTQRLIVEITDTPSQDIDLFVGTGTTPSSATAVCESATGAILEYCEISNPPAGDYWALAQNFLASAPGASDAITMAVGVLTPGDSENLSVSGPASVPAAEPFDVALNWDEPALQAGEAWYALVTLGTSPSRPDDIGTIAVNLYYHEPVEADLSIVKEAPQAVAPNEPINYTLTISNAGPDGATGVTVTDTLPLSVTFASASPACSQASGMVTCNIGDLAFDETVVLTVTATAPDAEGVIVTNTAAIASDQTDVALANNEDSAVTQIGTPTSDLSIVKEAPLSVIFGGTVTYTLTVSNAGPNDASGVTVTDTLPISVTFVSASPLCAQAEGVVTCEIGDLAAGETVVLTVTVTAPETVSQLINVAEVAGNEADPDLANNTDSVRTAVTEDGRLRVYLPVVFR